MTEPRSSLLLGWGAADGVLIRRLGPGEMVGARGGLYAGFLSAGQRLKGSGEG